MSTNAHIDPETGLEEGTLGRGAIVSLSLSSFLPAVGIAMVPLLVFTSAGTMAWASALLATVAITLLGIPVIYFARRFVATGSLYSYIGEVFGSWARVLTGAALLCGFVLAIGSLTGVVAIFFGSFLVGVGGDSALLPGPQTAMYVIAAVIGGAIAYRGLEASVRLAVLLTVVSLPLVVLISVASAIHTGLHLSEQFSWRGLSIGGVLQGVAAGAVFLVGFESSAALAVETRNPRKNIPIAVMAVPVILGGLYPLFTILQVPGLARVSTELAEGESAPAALAHLAGLGSAVASATDLVLAVAVFASLIGFINYGSRFLLSLAEDGLLPPSLTYVSARRHTPAVAIVVLCTVGVAVMAALTWYSGSGSTGYQLVAQLFVNTWLVPYVLIAVGAVVLSVRLRHRSVGLAICSLLGAGTMVWAFVNSLLNPPPPPVDAMSWFVFLVLALGVAVLLISRMLHRRRGSRSLEQGSAMTEELLS